MISIYFFLITVFNILGNKLIFNLKDKISKDFLFSISFTWNSLFIITLLEYINNKLSVFEYHDFSQIEIILSLNINLTKYRNTLIVCMFMYLAYGFYCQYISCQKKIYFVLAVISGIISLLMLYLSLLAGSFTI